MLREIRMKYSLMKNDFYGSKKTFLLMKIAPNQAKLIAKSTSLMPVPPLVITIHRYLKKRGGGNGDWEGCAGSGFILF
jgi:hypothetical protein